MITYLSGVTNSKIEGRLNELGVGLLIQPGNGSRANVGRFAKWAADNGAYAKGACADDFDFDGWWTWVQTLPRENADTCLFVTTPDAIDVSDDGRDVFGHAGETLARAREWLPRLRALGFPTAMVAQNGMEQNIDAIPWDDFDVLFVGGSTDWKLGAGAAAVVAEAKARGKRVHMGRVNSGKRLRYAASIGCDTADGTYLAFGPDKNLPKLAGWLRAMNQTTIFDPQEDAA